MGRRTAEGMSKTEVIRCLKRYEAREVYSALRSSSHEQLDVYRSNVFAVPLERTYSLEINLPTPEKLAEKPCGGELGQSVESLASSHLISRLIFGGFRVAESRRSR